jgi:CubicO group peptidase (beta-lactamase class C family)
MQRIKIFIRHLHRTAPVIILIYIVFVGFVFSCSGSGSGSDSDTSGGGQPLEYVTPEEVGYSSEKLEEAEQFAKESGYSAVMALYDGKVFFAWGSISTTYRCHSIRKPFLSALYGIYLAKGDINLAATLEDLHIDDIPPALTFAEKQAKVEHLLMSRSGVYHEAAYEAQIMIDTRPERGSHPPDTFFYYNNWDFNTLGTIFEQETGEGIFEAFRKNIADVAGMDDFRISNCNYHYEWDKSMHPAYLFKMSARDLARFGILYQKLGNLKGTQIISEAWIDESTMAYSIIDDTEGVGYGYMWAIIIEGGEMEQLIGYPGFYHTGVGIQVLVIIPELKLVIVELYDTDNLDEDPGDAGFQLGLMIIDARLDG